MYDKPPNGTSNLRGHDPYIKNIYIYIYLNIHTSPSQDGSAH